jgi:hypothetical protein
MVLNKFNVCSHVAIIELKFSLENFCNVVVPDPVGSASVWRIRISIKGLQILIRIGIYFNISKAKFHFFQENFNKLFKILKTMTPLMLKRKNVNWHCYENFFPDFPTCVKTWGRQHPDPDLNSDLDRRLNGKSDPDRQAAIITFNSGYRKSLSNRKRDSLPSDMTGTAAATSGLEAAAAATAAFFFGS